MNELYPQIRLIDICDQERGIRYGIVKVGNFVSDGIPVIRGGDIKSGKVAYDNNKKVTQEISDQFKRTILHGGEIVINLIGEAGHSAVVPEEYKGFNVTRDVAVIPLEDSVDTRFIDFYLRSAGVIEWMRQRLQGSVTLKINLETLRDVPVYLPPICEQKAITNILGTLDDKIELNRKTNETLEAMAKALFKSWFVDFDPVRAKAEGRPTGLPAEISDLFPDSFEDSELGEIPSGWSVRRLRDFIKPVKDRQGDRNIEEYSATVTGIEPRDSRFKKNLSRSGDKNKVALEGDLVFGLSRRTINFGRMAQPIGAFSSVYEVFRSTSGSTISTKIVEQCIRLRMSEFMIILKPAAREGQAIDREVLLEQLIADFPEQVNTLLEILLEPVSKRIELTSEHIFALEQLRDALLPKLISGEIRIPDAEKMLEEVGI